MQTPLFFLRTMVIAAASLAFCFLLVVPAFGESPDNCDLPNDRGRAEDPHRQIERCTAFIESGGAFGQDLGLAYNSRASAYQDIGEYERAIEDYDRAIAAAPKIICVFQANRGVANYHLGNFQRAIEDCNEALRLQPRCTMALYTRAAAFSKLGEHQLALEDIDKALEIHPDDYRFYFARGAYHQRLGQHRLAIEDFGKALLEEPEYAEVYYSFGEVYYQRGRSYMNIGDRRLAEKEFAKAVTHDPNHAEAHNAWAWVLYLLGRSAEAKDAAIQALALTPNDPFVQDTHAHVLAALGQREEALIEFERAIQTGGYEFVRNYQQELAKQGFYRGEFDGIYDPDTRAALISCIAVACRLAD